MDNQKDVWNSSYDRKDNYVFFPTEEIVRFVAKYYRKRTGIRSFIDRNPSGSPLRILDVGCGIGRHIMFCAEMGIEGYGFDMSDSAIRAALDWAETAGIENPAERIKVADVREIPWGDSEFDAAVSHGVFDSMPYAIAKMGIVEVARVLKPGGLFYCDVVSGNDSQHAREFAEEEIVQTSHEQGTVQSYFNYQKVVDLFSSCFDILECALIRRENVTSGEIFARYHVAVRNKKN